MITVEQVKEKMPELFWTKIKFGEPDDCWEWTRSLNGIGYPYFQTIVDGKHKNVLGHRFLYRLVYGLEKIELQVCHTCDNRKCCNPNHYFLGTQSDNLNDMVKKGRYGKRNLPFGSKHSQSKLTEEKVMLIKMRLAIGEADRHLSRVFQVNRTTIRAIRKGKVWKHVQIAS